LSAVVQSLFRDNYGPWLLPVDLATLLGFGILTWRSSRDWPVIATAFQGVAVAVGALFLFDVSIAPPLYVASLAVSSIGVLGAILWGIVTAWKPDPPAPPIV